MPKKYTSIELKINKLLTNMGIVFKDQILLEGVGNMDFFLPNYRIVIQCDGNYWHSKQKVKDRDINQDLQLMFKGYTILRFSETDIHKNIKKCQRKISDAVKALQ